MSSCYPYRPCNNFCDDYHRFCCDDLKTVEEIIPIEDITVEDFLKRFPEFKVLLDDTDLSEDFIYSNLMESKLDIEFGQWPSQINQESVYLLAAHLLQTRFDQQSLTASKAVAASQGKHVQGALNNNPNPTVNLELVNTVYGNRLLRLREQTRPLGGIVL